MLASAQPCEIEWHGTRVLVPTALMLVLLGFILLHQSSGAYDLGQDG